MVCNAPMPMNIHHKYPIHSPQIFSKLLRNYYGDPQKESYYSTYFSKKEVSITHLLTLNYFYNMTSKKISHSPQGKECYGVSLVLSQVGCPQYHRRALLEILCSAFLKRYCSSWPPRLAERCHQLIILHAQRIMTTQQYAILLSSRYFREFLKSGKLISWGYKSFRQTSIRALEIIIHMTTG